jgi:hypothetical protein
VVVEQSQRFRDLWPRWWTSSYVTFPSSTRRAIYLTTLWMGSSQWLVIWTCRCIRLASERETGVGETERVDKGQSAWRLAISMGMCGTPQTQS